MTWHFSDLAILPGATSLQEPQWAAWVHA